MSDDIWTPEALGSAEYVWGVDPSTKRVAIGAADRERVHEVTLCEFDRKLKSAPRMADIYARTHGAALRFARRFPPIYVWVEQPMAFGRPVEPQLMYAVGVIQLALFVALRDLYPHPVTVEPIQIAEWRKLAFGEGKGNVKKARYLDLMRPLGYEGDDLDECAAWGIARGGSLLVWPTQQSLEVA